MKKNKVICYFPLKKAYKHVNSTSDWIFLNTRACLTNSVIIIIIYLIFSIYIGSLQDKPVRVRITIKNQVRFLKRGSCIVRHTLKLFTAHFKTKKHKQPLRAIKNHEKGSTDSSLTFLSSSWMKDSSAISLEDFPPPFYLRINMSETQNPLKLLTDGFWLPAPWLFPNPNTKITRCRCLIHREMGSKGLDGFSLQMHQGEEG